MTNDRTVDFEVNIKYWKYCLEIKVLDGFSIMSPSIDIFISF